MVHWVRLLSMTYATVTELMLLLVQMNEHLLIHHITDRNTKEHLVLHRVPLGGDHLVYQIPHHHPHPQMMIRMGIKVLAITVLLNIIINALMMFIGLLLTPHHNVIAHLTITVMCHLNLSQVIVTMWQRDVFELWCMKHWQWRSLSYLRDLKLQCLSAIMVVQSQKTLKCG